MHCYMNERISSAVACRNLVRNILTRFKLPYITITPTFSICPKHGYIQGEHDFCPRCDEEMEFAGARFDVEYRKTFITEKVLAQKVLL